MWTSIALILAIDGASPKMSTIPWEDRMLARLSLSHHEAIRQLSANTVGENDEVPYRESDNQRVAQSVS